MSRPFRRSLSWRWWALGGFCLLLLGRGAFWGGAATLPTPFAGPCQIQQVLDGETLLVRPQTDFKARAIRVRLLGITVPTPQAAAASDYTRQRVATGTVSLTLDKRRIDSQGHVLAYVYVDGQLLNADLVRQGLAKVVPYPGDSATIGRELFRVQDLAHEKKLGIWATGGKPRPAIIIPEPTAEEPP